jgi:hypothetical protein
METSKEQYDMVSVPSYFGDTHRLRILGEHLAGDKLFEIRGVATIKHVERVRADFKKAVAELHPKVEGLRKAFRVLARAAGDIKVRPANAGKERRVRCSGS